ncbi:MAG TPA: hypothetical protein VLJ18_04910 [Thermoanaerobaculia bacterium]|nr:hypothetical protein [Thermoanaerobaculia bacterium]
MALASLKRVPRALGVSVLAAFLLLAGTAEERTFGTVSDEQQMLYTAISIAETFELGIARGQTFAIPRPQGDAVSPYGMGLPLLEVPFVLAAGPWEARFGARTSQSLFVLLQVLLVTAAAAGAGLLAKVLGAGVFGQGLAVFGTAVASPLWPYTACGFTEPLQAVCLVFAVTFAARASRAQGPPALGFAFAAGFCAGFLALTKVVNLLFVPLPLVPLLASTWPPARERVRVWAAALAGVAIPIAVMLAFEVVRFGRPFSSYARGRNFSHPPLDGAWRLLVGPNKGLLLYFPLGLFAAVGLVSLVRGRETRGVAASTLALAAGLLALYSGWWAWDGSGGWGPRFLVPLVPLLAAAAGAAAGTPARRAAGVGLVALGLGVNALGTLQAEAATFYYISSTGLARVPRALYEEYPPSFRPPESREGAYWLPRYVPAAADPAFSAFRVHPFLLANRLAERDDDERRRRLSSPPWLSTSPDAVPRLPAESPQITTQTPLVRYLASRFRWPHLFMCFGRPDGERPGTYSTAWVAGLADQTLRNLDISRPERAARLAEKLFGVSPSAYTAALRAEALRLSGRTGDTRAFLDSLPERVLNAPVLALVRALAARDAGQDAAAAALLSEAARGIRTITLRQALTRPPSEWPRSLRAFLSDLPDAP